MKYFTQSVCVCVSFAPAWLCASELYECEYWAKLSFYAALAALFCTACHKSLICRICRTKLYNTHILLKNIQQFSLFARLFVTVGLWKKAYWFTVKNHSTIWKNRFSLKSAVISCPFDILPIQRVGCVRAHTHTQTHTQHTRHTLTHPTPGRRRAAFMRSLTLTLGGSNRYGSTHTNNG